MHSAFPHCSRLIASAFRGSGALAALPTGAAADNPQIVNVVGCAWDIETPGKTTVQAGEQIILPCGWGAKTRGLVTDFIGEEDYTLTVNDQDKPDVDDLWGAPFYVPESPPDPAYWRAWVSYPIEALAPDTSVLVTLDLYLAHRLHDGFSYDGAPHPTFFGPGWFFGDEGPIGCQITAVNPTV